MATHVDLPAGFKESCFLSGAHVRPAFVMTADGDVLAWARRHATNNLQILWTARSGGPREIGDTRIARAKP